jgi:hypothetical protein
LLRLSMILIAAAAMIAQHVTTTYSAPTVPASINQSVTPAPFTATYSVRYRNLNAGLLHFQLYAEESGRFIYETNAEPSLLARFAVSRNAVERSVMRIDGDGVRPLFWFMDDGKAGREGDGAISFVWEQDRVRGTVRGKSIEQSTEPGLQDRLSIQIAVMTALLRGDEPGTIPLIDNDQIKRYSYTRADSGQLSTKAGEFETVLYVSTRPGSSRLSRIWHAPKLGFIPVRAEQVHNGRVETVMELVRIQRSAD